MSMFHELMMRKKEETLYPVIKGSLTESPYGVFSGFTPTNYLSLDCGTNTINQWEVSVDFLFPETQNAYNGIISRSSPAFQIYTYANTNNITVETNSGTNLMGFTNKIRGHLYNIHITYNAGSWVGILTDKTDGTSETKTATTSDIWYLSGIWRFGITQSGNYGFQGSINLNQSYIKLGSTKYNLQAVVGYTIVGSPTITDGVVSGFSNNNYLVASKVLPTTVGNDYIFEGEVSLSSLPSGTQYILSFNCNSNTGNSSFGFAFRSSGKFAIATSDGSSTTVTNGNLSYQANTIYKYRIETDLNTYFRLYINEELDLSLTLSYTIVKPYSGNVNYGVFITTNLPLSNGSMNINNTSIKVNNKLVFNGQQA